MLIPNTVFNGKIANYEVGELLGSGATSMVFAAHPAHDKTLQVVIKVMKPDTGKTSANLNAFQREVDVLNEWQKLAQGTDGATVLALFHPPTPFTIAYLAGLPLPTPYLVEARTSGAAPYYLVMEKVDGDSITKTLRDTGKPLAEDFGVRVALQFTTLLHLLHSRLERSFTDMKMENLWWHRVGRLMVTDWNVLSEKGQADIPRDLLHWGQILFLLFTGVPIEEYLYNGGIAETKLARLGTPYWEQLTPGMRAIFVRVFASQPNLRYPSMQALATDLECLHRAWNDSAGDLQVAILQRLFNEQGSEPARWMLAIADHRQLILSKRSDIDHQIAELAPATLKIDDLLTRLLGRMWVDARDLVTDYGNTINTPLAQLETERWHHVIALVKTRSVPDEKEWLAQLVGILGQKDLPAAVLHIKSRLNPSLELNDPEKPQALEGFQFLKRDSDYQTFLRDVNQAQLTSPQTLDTLEKARVILAELQYMHPTYAMLLAEVVPFPEELYQSLQNNAEVKEERQHSKLQSYVNQLVGFGDLPTQQFIQRLENRAEIARLQHIFEEFPVSKELRTALTVAAGKQLHQGTGRRIVAKLLEVVAPSPIFWDHALLRQWLKEIESAHTYIDSQKWVVEEWVEWRLLLHRWQRLENIHIGDEPYSVAKWLLLEWHQLAEMVLTRWIGSFQENDALIESTMLARMILQLIEDYLKSVENSDSQGRRSEARMDIKEWLDYRIHPWRRDLEKIDSDIRAMQTNPPATVAAVETRLKSYDALQALVSKHHLQEKRDLPESFRELLNIRLDERTRFYSQATNGRAIQEQLKVLLEMPSSPYGSDMDQGVLARLQTASELWQRLDLIGFEQADDVRTLFRTVGQTYIENRLAEASFFHSRRDGSGASQNSTPAYLTPKDILERLRWLIQETITFSPPFFNDSERMVFRARIDEQIGVYRLIAQVDQWLNNAEQKLPSLNSTKPSSLAGKIEVKVDAQLLHYIEMVLNEAEARLTKAKPPVSSGAEVYKWWHTLYEDRAKEYQTLHQRWLLIRNQQLEAARRLILQEAQNRDEPLYTIPVSIHERHHKDVTPEAIWQVVGQWGALHFKINAVEGLKEEPVKPQQQWLEYARDAAIITLSVPIVLIVAGLDTQRWYTEAHELMQMLDHQFTTMVGSRITDGRYTWGKFMMHSNAAQNQYKGRLLFPHSSGFQMPGFSGRKMPIDVTIIRLQTP